MPSDESSAEEIASYLSDHLEALGIEGWKVSVVRDGELATAEPNGSTEETLGDDEAPLSTPVFSEEPVPDDV